VTIPDYQIPKHLPDNPNAKIQVVFADSGRDALVANPAAIRAMSRCHMLNGEINKHGYLKFVRLLVSIREAYRIKQATERPAQLPRHAITRFKQSRGAKRWVWRPDNAQCGRMGGVESIFI
jgi:hypothetical protein